MADGCPLSGQHGEPGQHLGGALTVQVQAGVDVTSQQVQLCACQVISTVHTAPNLNTGTARVSQVQLGACQAIATVHTAPYLNTGTARVSRVQAVWSAGRYS